VTTLVAYPLMPLTARGDGLGPQPGRPGEVAGPSNYPKITRVC